MLSVFGIYENGSLKLDEDYSTGKPVKVMITFLEEVPNESEEKVLSWDDFSFSESQKALADFKGSFAETVIEERRGES